MSRKEWKYLLGAGLILSTALYAFFQDNVLWYGLPSLIALLWLVDILRSPNRNAGMVAPAFDRAQAISRINGATAYVCGLREGDKHQLVLQQGHIIRREIMGGFDVWIVNPTYVPEQPDSQLVEIRFTPNFASADIGGGQVAINMLLDEELAAASEAMWYVHNLAMQYAQV